MKGNIRVRSQHSFALWNFQIVVSQFVCYSLFQLSKLFFGIGFLHVTWNMRKPGLSLDSPILCHCKLALVLRVLLNIMYLIVETIHQECEGDKAEWRTMRQTFRAELGRNPGELFLRPCLGPDVGTLEEFCPCLWS